MKAVEIFADGRAHRFFLREVGCLYVYKVPRNCIRRWFEMNRYKFLFLLITIYLFSAIPNTVHAISARAKVTLKVVNEEGQPIEGATVGVGFGYDKTWATGVTAKDGISDDKGNCTVSEYCNDYIGYGADMEGYYDSNYSGPLLFLGLNLPNFEGSPDIFGEEWYNYYHL